MISRAKLIANARLCLNTKHHHQGRVPGVGLDCIGLLVFAPLSQGIILEDRCNYPRDPTGELQLELERQFDPLPSFDHARPGDVLVFWYVNRRLPQHVGIKTDKGMIHTYQDVGKVVETSLGAFWEPRAQSAWAYRGIEPWQP